MVYVQDINGKPMMPTTRYGKVRRLLKENKAVVVSLCPFTIKLTYVTSDYKQEIVLGVDAGTKHVGLSATTKSKEPRKAMVRAGNSATRKIIMTFRGKLFKKAFDRASRGKDINSFEKQEKVDGLNFLYNPNNDRMRNGHIIIDGTGLFKQIMKSGT